MSIRRNSQYNLVGGLVPLLFSLITIPIYLDLIGTELFGVLALAWLFLGYFGAFDLGLGRATAQRIAAQKNDAIKHRAQTFWTALTINLAMGAVGSLIIWPFATYFFGSVFKIDDVLRDEVLQSLPWLVLAFPISLCSGVLTGALQGREKFLALNVVSTLGTILFQLCPIIAAIVFGPTLELLLCASILARVLTLLTLFACCWKHVFRSIPPGFSQQSAWRLLSFGGWISISAFLGPIIVLVDRFIIGAVYGAKEVTYYTVPFQLGERSTILSRSLTSALFPRLSFAEDGDKQRLVREATGVLICVSTLPTIIGLLIIEWFLSVWIDSSFALEAAVVGQVILIGFWINGFASIAATQLQAKGRPDLTAKCHMLEILPYIGLLYVGLTFFGLIGAAVAFALRSLLDFVLLAGLSGELAFTLRKLLAPGLTVFAALLISLNLEFFSMEWGLIVCIYLPATLLIQWKQAPDSVTRYFIKFRKVQAV